MDPRCRAGTRCLGCWGSQQRGQERTCRAARKGSSCCPFSRTLRARCRPNSAFHPRYQPGFFRGRRVGLGSNCSLAGEGWYSCNGCGTGRPNHRAFRSGGIWGGRPGHGSFGHRLRKSPARRSRARTGTRVRHGFSRTCSGARRHSSGSHCSCSNARPHCSCSLSCSRRFPCCCGHPAEPLSAPVQQPGGRGGAGKGSCPGGSRSCHLRTGHPQRRR
jgi:hypothetical protein